MLLTRQHPASTRLINAILLIVALLGSGCSTEAEPPPIASQSRDLLDDDNDGVINARDKCAATPHQAIVDNDGCPTFVKRNEANDLHILFANDSTVIPDKFLSEISRMAAFLSQYPEARIELKGYASPVGGHDYNLDLSKRRAEVVRRHLINLGVAPKRIITVGFGDNEPVAAATPEQTNTLSRRVTARVRGSQGQVLEEWTVFSLKAD
ncbi:membrane protein [Photobacterium aquae]|uniref:Membrane protein n=1 Tax=Photobacterium aquae TaxID=1195763 RepID=A0A0J1H151_9GAMM|nr:OmpA family protein [Photobacterium aquae]KLV05529.1 membrane protein [Photobacterium aquae]